MTTKQDKSTYNMKSKQNLKELPYKFREGIVILNTGNGKGKTTAAFGQALRAVGNGYKVCIIQFMKGRKYGEYVAAGKYLPNLKIHLVGLDSFVMRDHPSPNDIEMAQKGFALAKKVIESGNYRKLPLKVDMLKVEFSGILPPGGSNEEVTIYRNPDYWDYQGSGCGNADQRDLPQACHF